MSKAIELKKLERDRSQYKVYLQSIEIKMMECAVQMERLQKDMEEKRLMLKEVEEKINEISNK